MKLRLGLVSALAVLSVASLAYAEPKKGGVIDVATVGEPPTLDSMATATDLVGMISQHIFETLADVAFRRRLQRHLEFHGCDHGRERR